MSTRAVMDAAWNVHSSQAAEWLARWSRQEFGAEAAPAVERCYRAYYEAPARYGEGEADTMADDFYHQLGRDLLVRHMRGDESMPVRFHWFKAASYPGYTSKVVNMCREAEDRWTQAARLVAEARPLVPSNRREFFQAHVATQVDLHLHLNRMLRHVAEAASPGVPIASQQVSVEAAARQMRAALDALRKAEYGKWGGFYTLGDWFVDMPLTLHLAEACLTQLRGQRLSTAESATLARAERMLRDDSSHLFTRIKAYQQGQKVQFCISEKPPHF